MLERCRYLELHFLIHFQQRGHGRAGPCPLRWRPEALWAPGRGPEGPEESRQPSGPRRPLWLSHYSLVPSLRAGRTSGRPPAACCLLAPSLALPAFAAHAGSYVTANRRDSCEVVHVLRAASLRLSSVCSWDRLAYPGSCTE